MGNNSYFQNIPATATWGTPQRILTIINININIIIIISVSA